MRRRLADEAEFGSIVIKTGTEGRVTRVRDVARVELAAPEEAIAPGQACVFYRDSRVLGGGFIARSLQAEAA